MLNAQTCVFGGLSLIATKFRNTVAFSQVFCADSVIIFVSISLYDNSCRGLLNFLWEFRTYLGLDPICFAILEILPVLNFHLLIYHDKYANI